MIEKILLLVVFLSLIFSSGCIQNSPSNAPQFTNQVEENISRILVTSNSVNEVWSALEDEKIPEKIGYRPSSSNDNVWIIAEIDPINNTWIAIDVDQKEIIHNGENNSYFSGIFFDNYSGYEKELSKKAWTPLSFSPIHSTTALVPISPTPTPPNLSNNLEFDINISSIFLEALISVIIGAFLIFLIGFDLLDRLGYIIVIICLMGGGLALFNHPSNDVATITSELSNFLITWVINIVTMALSGMFGALIGAFLKMGTDIFKTLGQRGGRRGRRRRERDIAGSIGNSRH